MQQNFENKAKWEQALERQKEELKAWFDTCPAHLFDLGSKGRVLDKAIQELDPQVKRWDDRLRPLGTREIISRVEDQWLAEAKCDSPMYDPRDKDASRLRDLILHLCQDKQLKRKSWVQEAIDLATKKGFHNLAQNVIPHIRQWRQELWDLDNAW